ncbi:LysE family transporter [Desulfovibrio sulfodismutans]|uniref:LysE family transporter n=1 Tax=Desulfolutivibrio sulfodismutans TaxID=63561 RepID=A0A7K3NQ72_9BACT|nr:LysE family transporter [Desulfolutivibrio sulfodismutans]NDY58362.1 LysE family transporter [Desulfolutivibrio sulfodismutans]QLA11981.1 lysine transporter LysE [Desulfolutivibrio sulfodismutans DSM 3696]
MALYFLKGLAIGLIIAMPFGPVGLLCLQRAITMGLRVGLLSGLGAGLADTFYGAVAAFGLTYISDFLTTHHILLQSVGGLFLALMGVRLYLTKKAPKTLELTHSHFAGAFASIFVLTLTNPMTFVAFLAIFAGFGLGQAEARMHHAVSVVVGVFFGAMVWWVAIALGGKLLRFRLLNQLPKIRKGSGVIIILFGIWAVADAIFRFPSLLP